MALTESASDRGSGRIWFPGNPWPDGHRLESCELVRMVDPRRGAYVDGVVECRALPSAIELRSAPYDEGDEPSERDAIGVDDCSSKIAWNNYGSAWIGATASGAMPGFQVSDGSIPFQHDKDTHHFVVDRLPLGLPSFSDFFQRQAFGCYLLGHDAVADHDIRLNRTSDGSYHLDWTGRLALAYGGAETFDYSFVVNASGVRLREICLWYLDVERAQEHLGIKLDVAITPREYLAPFVTDVDAFSFDTRIDGLGRSVVCAVPNHG
jgi:hypothetical protein